MKRYLKDLLRDKNGNLSLRETATALFVVVILISWIAHQFFGLEVPEFMFYAFVSLVGAGCFGYSIERKQTFHNKFKPHHHHENKTSKHDRLSDLDHDRGSDYPGDLP